MTRPVLYLLPMFALGGVFLAVSEHATERQGGVLLQWLLGYNFSVAVWVGYIALYGVAVQTGSSW